jgi:hypothetical protein
MPGIPFLWFIHRPLWGGDLAPGACAHFVASFPDASVQVALPLATMSAPSIDAEMVSPTLRTTITAAFPDSTFADLKC